MLDWPLACDDAGLPVPAGRSLALVPRQLGAGVPPHPRGGRAGDRALRRVPRRHPGRAGVPPRAAQPGDLRATSTTATATPTVGDPAGRRCTGRRQRCRQRDDRAWSCGRRLGVHPRRHRRSACWPRSCSTCAGSSTRCRSWRSSTTCSRPRPRRSRSSRACSTRSPTVAEPVDAGARCPTAPRRRRASTPSRFALPRDRPRPARPRPRRSRPARPSRSSARPARARRRSPGSSARFYDPIDGAVPLDGVDLRDLADADLRRAVVTVTQENFLFSGSVADNIALGRPERDPRRDRGRRAAPSAPTSSSPALPDGYDTDVRQRGARLSAGQRQLVAFARAVPRRPRGADPRRGHVVARHPSERLVQRALRTLLADRTAVIIAHRLSHRGDRRPGPGGRRRPHRRGRRPRPRCSATVAGMPSLRAGPR